MVTGYLPITILSQNTIKERLMELSQAVHRHLISTLPDDGKISIALDYWTSPDQKPFIAITSYYILTNFKYNEILLGFPSIPGTHTGVYLAKILIEVLQKHSLSQ